MKIIPLFDLRNTAAVSRDVLENSTLFVTKQGSEHIVMLSHEMYEDIKRENNEVTRVRANIRGGFGNCEKRERFKIIR